MAKMIELLSEEDVKAFLPNAEDALLRAIEWRQDHPEQYGKGYRSTPEGAARYFTVPGPRLWEDALETAETIARYVHGVMMSQARPDNRLGGGFTHTWFGYPKDIVRQFAGDLLNDGQKQTLSAQVTRILTNNRLARRIGKGRSRLWHLRAWPAGEHITKTSYVYSYKQMPSKDKARTEQRIAEEADKPVSHIFDLGYIAAPDPKDPMSFVEWAKRVKKSYGQLSHAYETAQTTITELEETNKELESRLQELESSEWEVAAQRLADLMEE